VFSAEEDRNRDSYRIRAEGSAGEDGQKPALGRDPDSRITHRPLELVNWRSYLTKAQGYGIEGLERQERTGRLLGDDRFIELAEKLLSPDLKKKKPGPKVADK
jgi:hypothetical protein